MDFTVKAISRDGTKAVFPRSAAGRDELLRQLRAEGFAVVSIDAGGAAEHAPAPCDLPFWHPAWLKRTGRFEIEMGLRQLSSMLKSGVPLLLALKTVSGQSSTPRMSRTWKSVADAVVKGESLASALSAQGKSFGEVTVRLAEAGEKSGELDKTLSRAADQMSARRELKASVANALLYPFVAIAMSIGVSAFLVTSVIPKLASFLRAGDVELPAATQALVDFSDFARLNGAAILHCIAAAAIAWLAVRAGRKGRELEDAFLLKIPVTGKILRISGTALFSRAMQIMTESGVTITDALETAAGVLANKRLERRVEEAREGVIRGETLASAVSRAREFMPMLASMTAVGETSGAICDAFDETAKFHETMLALSVKRFGMLIEPAMILVTGGIVGFVYIAFFMAVFAIAGAS